MNKKNWIVTERTRKHKIKRETDMEREGDIKVEIYVEKTIYIQRYETYKARKRKTNTSLNTMRI